MFVWTRDKGSPQPATSCGCEIAVVRRHNTNLFRLEHERFCRAEIGFGAWFVGLCNLGSEDGIPGQTCSFCNVQHQPNVAIGERSNDEAPPKALQTGNTVGPWV